MSLTRYHLNDGDEMSKTFQFSFFGGDNLIECPNSAKPMRESFAYCRICGSRLDGESPGDYATDVLNVFKNGDEYMYLFAESGNQVVLKAGSMDELAQMVEKRKYPWILKTDSGELL